MEKAFAFPVSVAPRVEGGAVTALAFRIDPHFVPTYGTLALSAAVQAQTAVVRLHYPVGPQRTLLYAFTAS